MMDGGGERRPWEGRCAAGVLAALCMCAAAGGQVLRVDADRPPGGDGHTWAGAFNDLQDALAAAATDESITEIWVAEGAYAPDGDTGDRALTFTLVPGVALLGGFAGDETIASKRDPLINVTVLTGDLLGDDGPNFTNRSDNSVHVINASDANDLTLIDGFTIRGGNADGACCFNDRGGAVVNAGGGMQIINCTFESNRALRGGAVFASDGMVIIDQCVFTSNRSGRGGAIECVPGVTLEVLSTSFDQNDAVPLIGPVAVGGAVSCDQTSAMFTDCSFTGNLAIVPSGSFAVGGAIASQNSAIELIECALDFNVSHSGGAVSGRGNATLSMTGCNVTGNLAFNEGGAVAWQGAVNLIDSAFDGNIAQTVGGAVDVSNGAATIEQCSFFDNGAAQIGGALRLASFAGAVHMVSSCTFVSNEAETGGAIHHSGDGLIEDAQFVTNLSLTDGGAVWLGAGAVQVRRSLFARNTALGAFGGGLSATDTALDLVACTFNGNDCNDHGGGAHVIDGALAARSCVFVGNRATEGAGLWVESDSALVRGCTFAANDADNRAAGLRVVRLNATVSECILWGNTAGPVTVERAQVFVVEGNDITFSCIEGLNQFEDSPGNIGDDPQFIRAPNDGGDGWGLGANDDFGDVHLRDDSPCVNAGDYTRTVESDEVDIDGQSRAIECRPDIGSDESPFFARDCNANGIADACDITMANAPDCNVNGLIDACEIDDGAAPDCNGNGVPDVCDIADEIVQDCNANGVPDACELEQDPDLDCNRNGVPDSCELVPATIHCASPRLGPIGNTGSQTAVFDHAPAAASDVEITVVAFGDFDTEFEFVNIRLGGVIVGRLFDVNGADCTTLTESLTVSAAQFNAAITNDSVAVTILASGAVNAIACSGVSFVSVELDYDAAFPTDVNGDGQLDVCECPADCATPANGVVDVAYLIAVLSAWGEAGGPCDVNFNGIVGVDDLIIVLSSWGVCP